MKTARTFACPGCLAVLSFGLIAVLAQAPPTTGDEPWIVPARSARKQNPVLPDDKSVAQGKELYVAGCFPCHGSAGKGDGAAAATLERNGKPVRPGNLSDPKMWQQSDGALFSKISEGRTPMPAFQESFTEEQRWQIVNYIRTLAPKEKTNTPQTKNGTTP